MPNPSHSVFKNGKCSWPSWEIPSSFLIKVVLEIYGICSWSSLGNFPHISLLNLYLQSMGNATGNTRKYIKQATHTKYTCFSSVEMGVYFSIAGFLPGSMNDTREGAGSRSQLESCWLHLLYFLIFSMLSVVFCGISSYFQRFWSYFGTFYCIFNCVGDISMHFIVFP